MEKTWHIKNEQKTCMQGDWTNYQALSGSFCALQNDLFWVSLWLALQSKWFFGFCQMAISSFSTSLFQQRLLATFSILVCSSFSSSFFLCHPFQYFFQLIGGPDRIQYPPGRRNRSTSLRKIPSVSTIKWKRIIFYTSYYLKSLKVSSIVCGVINKNISVYGI